MEEVRKGIQGKRLHWDDRSWPSHRRSLTCSSAGSMNLKEQCEGQQQRRFQDVSSECEGRLRENIMFVNVTKPGQCCGMICHFSAREDPSGKAATKRMGGKPAFGTATAIKVRGKDAAVTKAQVIKV